MRLKSTASAVLALAAAGALAGGAAHAQQVTQGAPITVTPSNANVLNLLSPFLSLNGTGVGQQTLNLNLSQAIATNNNATAAQQALAVSDKNLFGGRTNTITLANGSTATYGIAANLAGGLPAQAQVTPAAGATTTSNTTPIQAVGGLGSVLGPIYQRGVQPIGTGAATTAILANTATLLNTAYGSFTSVDLGVAKNYFANGAAANSANAPYVTNPARAPAGYTLPTYTLPSGEVLPNTTNSVLDIAAGVTNTQAGQDVYGSSRPVQVRPTPPNGINQFDSTSIAGLATNPSFPSGHTNYAFTDSTLIGMLVPQSFQSMLLRGAEYGNSRIVLGVHYPLDIIASRSFSTYDLVQAFTNPAYQNGTNTSSSFNLATQFSAARGEIQRSLPVLDPTGQCGGSVAACATSTANTANDPYVPSDANAATYLARLTYGLPTLVGAPKELTDTQGLSAAIILAPLYGGSPSAAVTAIAPNGGIDGNLSTATINQIIANTENDPLQAFYGSQLSYWSRINLYAAAGYFNGVVGTLSLASSDLVTQNVTIASGGTLDANGRVTGTTTVASGGTLTGAGTVGTVSVANGGTLAPGSLAAQAALQNNQANVSGTRLTTTDGVTFAPSSTFAVSASQTQVTNLAASGTATLNGAAVTVTLPTAVGSFPTSQNNRILSASGGVSGTFSGVTSNLLFATPTLSYDSNDAYLSFGNPNFQAAATNQNQRNVAAALNNGAAANPSSPVVTNLETLNSSQGAAGAAALNSLSGSGLTATQNLAHRSTQEFVSSVSDQLTLFGQAPGVNSVTFTDEAAARAQGFAPVRELADLPASRVAPVVPAERPRSFRLWATGFGGVENFSGNGGVGFGGENNQIVGGSAGIDYQFLPGALVGIAAGGTSGNFNVPAFATSGSTTGGHVAGYTLMNYGAYYGAASLTGSFFSNKTTRTVAGVGALGETDNGSFNSREVRLRLEGGRRFAGFGGSVTPFVALELADLRSSGFTEFNRAGPTQLGLTINGQDSADVPAFVGARFERVTQLGNGMVFTPALQVAYVHDFAPQRSQLGSFAGLPQAVFLVDGARPAYNSVQVKAGAELAITQRAALFANFDGEFSGIARFYGGKGGFRYAF